MFPVFMLLWGTLELFEPAEEAGDLGGTKMLTSSFLENIFSVAIQQYVKDISKEKINGGYKLHGTFCSPVNEKEYPFYFERVKEREFDPESFTFWVVDSCGWGQFLFIEITDEGFWCQEDFFHSPILW